MGQERLNLNFHSAALRSLRQTSLRPRRLGPHLWGRHPAHCGPAGARRTTTRVGPSHRGPDEVERRGTAGMDTRLAEAQEPGLLGPAHLVAPLEHVLLPVLDGAVDVQELQDAVPPHVVGVPPRLLPAQRRALGQQPHGPVWRGRKRPSVRPLGAGDPPPPDRPAGRGGGGPAGCRPGGRAPSPLLPRRGGCGPGAARRLPLPRAGVAYWLPPTCDQSLRRRRACPVGARTPPLRAIRAPRLIGRGQGAGQWAGRGRERAPRAVRRAGGGAGAGAGPPWGGASEARGHPLSK